MKIEQRLDADQCFEIARRILRWFHTTPALAGGRTFGVDWPTMRALFPNKVAVYRRLRARYLELTK